MNAWRAVIVAGLLLATTLPFTDANPYTVFRAPTEVAPDAEVLMTNTLVHAAEGTVYQTVFQERVPHEFLVREWTIEPQPTSVRVGVDTPDGRFTIIEWATPYIEPVEQGESFHYSYRVLTPAVAGVFTFGTYTFVYHTPTSSTDTTEEYTYQKVTVRAGEPLPEGPEARFIVEAIPAGGTWGYENATFNLLEAHGWPHSGFLSRSGQPELRQFDHTTYLPVHELTASGEAGHEQGPGGKGRDGLTLHVGIFDRERARHLVSLPHLLDGHHVLMYDPDAPLAERPLAAADPFVSLTDDMVYYTGLRFDFVNVIIDEGLVDDVLSGDGVEVTGLGTRTFTISNDPNDANRTFLREHLGPAAEMFGSWPLLPALEGPLGLSTRPHNITDAVHSLHVDDLQAFLDVQLDIDVPLDTLRDGTHMNVKIADEWLRSIMSESSVTELVTDRPEVSFWYVRATVDHKEVGTRSGWVWLPHVAAALPSSTRGELYGDVADFAETIGDLLGVRMPLDRFAEDGRTYFRTPVAIVNRNVIPIIDDAREVTS